MIKLFTLLSMIGILGGVGDIAKVNGLKKTAEQAYLKGDYEAAATAYSYLSDTMLLEDEKVTMNLANCYYKLGKADQAQRNYQKLTLSKDNKIKSLAYQQLGAMSNDPKTLNNALTFFKEALRSDPSNDDARYNYELVKKKLKDQNQDDQNKDKNEDQDKKDEDKEQENEDKKDGDSKEQKDQKGDQNKDQQSEDQKDQEQQKGEDQKSEDQKSEDEKKQGEEGKDGENKDKEDQQAGKEGEENKDAQKPDMPPSTSEKLKQMNISQEKAKMILEALKNSEIQYIQQNQRKATKSKDSGKPDW